jgi:radical SAM protein (TIGR01212 family)
VGGAAFLRRRYGAKDFILYFQAYSGTFAPVEDLRRLYDYALSREDFRELIVSTRPDCVDAEKAALLADYIRPGRDVWVELGLQSFHPRTLERVRRGHGPEEFEAAFALLKARGVKVAVHLIFGLPGEGWKEIAATVSRLGRLLPDGVKIHDLHIPGSSALAAEHLSGELSLPCAARHLDYVVRALELLPEETLIMRVTCDTPAGRLAFPRRPPDKGRFLEALRARLDREDTRQGRFFSKS